MIELLTSTAFAAVLLVPCLGEKLGYGACEEELLDVFSAVESRDKCGDFCDSTPGCGFYSYCPKGGKGSKGSCDTMGLMSSKAGFGYGIGEQAPTGAKGNNQACVLFKAGRCKLSLEKWKGNGYETYRKYEVASRDMSSADAKIFPAAVIGGLLSFLAFGVVVGVAQRWWRRSASSESSEPLADSEHDEELSE
eukprot:TRINITY_DN5287_c0_g1_i2.p1 TRINITY_DN5287_c0_g1~~TRINITY_DN5287_c0_g1_i2.p1  ORF type:complete len:193 (-),score=46.92 TRINITY_DN5287_c0_g1_i2:117-695(-)